MREVIRDSGRLEHILTAIGNVQSFLEGKTLDDLCRDKILFYAVVKNIEIIGEAANNLTKGLASAASRSAVEGCDKYAPRVGA